MSKEIPFNQDKKENIIFSNTTGTLSIAKFVFPLRMAWKPKEDITTHELAMCLPYLLRQSFVMPYEVNKDEPYMRHFEIHDPNLKP